MGGRLAFYRSGVPTWRAGFKNGVQRKRGPLSEEKTVNARLQDVRQQDRGIAGNTDPGLRPIDGYPDVQQPGEAIRHLSVDQRFPRRYSPRGKPGQDRRVGCGHGQGNESFDAQKHLAGASGSIDDHRNLARLSAVVVCRRWYAAELVSHCLATPGSLPGRRSQRARQVSNPANGRHASPERSLIAILLPSNPIHRQALHGGSNAQ